MFLHYFQIIKPEIKALQEDKGKDQSNTNPPEDNWMIIHFLFEPCSISNPLDKIQILGCIKGPVSSHCVEKFYLKKKDREMW